MNYAITKRSYVSLPAHLAHAALVIFVVVNSPGTASAAFILQKSAGTPLPQGNLVQYTISLVGTQGETFGGFGFRNPSINPVGAGLGIHNVAAAFTNHGTPTKSEHTPGLWNSDWSPYDTYFLFDATNSVSLGPNFEETNDGTTTGTLGLTLPPFAAVPRSGFGIYTAHPLGSKVLPPTLQSSNVPFMQVVLRSVDSARLRVNLQFSGAPPVEPWEIVIGPFVVPEPSTVALLAVAAIGVVAHHRRDRHCRSLFSPSSYGRVENSVKPCRL